MNETKTQNTIAVTSTEAWFNQLVHDIRVDELTLKTKTINPIKEGLYSDLIAGNTDKVIHEFKDLLSKHVISQITLSYMKELVELLKDSIPLKLAFRLTNSKILVWAEIKDDDDTCEDALIIAEAKINALYGDKGFHISSTIVEASDKLLLPPHYTNVIAV